MARRPTRDDDRDEIPPWMEQAREPVRARAPARAAEQTHTLVSWRALIIGAVLAVLAAVGLIWGVRTLIAREPGATAITGTAANTPGEVPLIRAPATPYKIKPLDAGGAQLAGAGGGSGTGDPTTSAAGGDAIGAIIDTAAAPEVPQRPSAAAAAAAPTDILPQSQDAEAGDAEVVPVRPTPRERTVAVIAPTKAKASSASTAARAPEHKPAVLKAKRNPEPEPAPIETAVADRFRLPTDMLAKPKPASPSPSPGGSLQLGAFSTREKAEAAWARDSAAFPEVAALHQRITPLERDGHTLYRLRASGAGGQGTAICAKLKAAGDACMVSP